MEEHYFRIRLRLSLLRPDSAYRSLDRLTRRGTDAACLSDDDIGTPLRAAPGRRLRRCSVPIVNVPRRRLIRTHQLCRAGRLLVSAMLCAPRTISFFSSIHACLQLQYFHHCLLQNIDCHTTPGAGCRTQQDAVPAPWHPPDLFDFVLTDGYSYTISLTFLAAACRSNQVRVLQSTLVVCC